MAKGIYFKTKRDQKGGEWLTKDATNMADKEFILDVLRAGRQKLVDRLTSFWRGSAA
jgi:hypothetical protein